MLGVISRYKALLTTARRVYGAYRRYGIGEYGEFEDFVHVPKKITEGSIRALEKSVNRIRAAGEGAVRGTKRRRELREKTGYDNPKLFFDNLESTLIDAIRARREGARDAMEKSFNLLWDMIERARARDGDVRAAIALADFSAHVESDLARLVRALYDAEFKNARYMVDGEWRQDKSGATAYRRYIYEVGAALNINPSPILMDMMGGNVSR